MELILPLNVFAVTPAQIEDLNLPQERSKPQDLVPRNGENHPSVELDALPVPVLRTLVERSIKKHIDFVEWERMLQVEAAERTPWPVLQIWC